MKYKYRPYSKDFDAWERFSEKITMQSLIYVKDPIHSYISYYSRLNPNEQPAFYQGFLIHIQVQLSFPK